MRATRCGGIAELCLLEYYLLIVEVGTGQVWGHSLAHFFWFYCILRKHLFSWLLSGPAGVVALIWHLKIRAFLKNQFFQHIGRCVIELLVTEEAHPLIPFTYQNLAIF